MICPLPSFLLMLATTLRISSLVPLKIHLFIHSIKFLLSPDYVLGTVLGAGDTAEKTDMALP